MISAGTSITSLNDQLVKCPVDNLYNAIKNPKPAIEAKVRQLLATRQIDKKRYDQLKKELPYLVCGQFNPPFRRTENFAFTEYFFVDIDHIKEKGFELSDLRLRLQTDDRVVLSFLSPSGDGLKLLFKFSERCHDSGLYKIFYKKFVQQFSIQYSLEQVIDKCTNDVCRACFISIDPNVYYNKEAQTVNLKDYVDETNSDDLFGLNHKQKNTEQKQQPTPPTDDSVSADPDDSTMAQIRAILKMRAPKAEKSYYVPEQLDSLITIIVPQIENQGIKVSEIRNISYGKQLTFILGFKKAEVNIFYGKKGVSVVKSAKNGTDAELNTLVAELIEMIITQQ